MTTIVLPGSPVQTISDSDRPKALDGVLDLNVIAQTQVTAQRGGEALSKADVPDVDPTDIVEIELENGLKIWQSVQDAQQDYASVDRSLSDQSLLIPRHLPIAKDASRMGGTYAVKAIKIFKATLSDKAGSMTAFKLAERIESKLTPGFFKCRRNADTPTPEIVFDAVDPAKLNPKKSMLVLVHGTFSSTNGSFADLLGPPDKNKGAGPRKLSSEGMWETLEADYPAGIFALEHKTVTVDPVTNALDLVSALPKGAKISLMSHSRGGLVVELIARAARHQVKAGAFFDEIDYGVFEKADRNIADLEALNAALVAKNITVERVIRVAAPMRGTSLASKRLDRFLSIALNALELIPALRVSPAYDLFKAFLLGFIKTKADPETLPGLEAMMPSSPLVRLLNRPDLRLATDYHIIAGDNEGTGLLRKLRNLALDLFFQDENDFVVNTPSMSGGAIPLTVTRTTPIRTGNITHFTYFRTDLARNAILAARNPLPRAATSDFPFDNKLHRFPKLGSRGDTTRPICFLLPGVMGSHLNAGDKWIWTNPVRMATGGMKRLRYPGNNVHPNELMSKYYGDLAEFLARTHNVIPFDYDWRASVIDTGAKTLALAVRQALNETDAPIRFVAHSMGGLVVRAMIDAHPDLWTQIKLRNGSRFVMLGTPNGGAFSMMHTMMGRSKAIQQLAAVDLAHSKRELLDIVTSMPGPAQLLPADQGGHYLKTETWQDLHALDNAGWVIPAQDTLAAAQNARRLFASQTIDGDITCYVAGLGSAPTPSGLRINSGASGTDRVQFLGTHKGDGTVTWATGIPKTLDPYYLPVVHGDLACTPSAFPAIQELLSRGDTNALSRIPPATRHAIDEEDAPLPAISLDILPQPLDVIDSLMGATSIDAKAAQQDRPKTKVTIVHGDLRYARFPVLTGHYEGDPLYGAEAALDQCLGYHLSAVRDLGLYPGAIDTCDVFLRLSQKPGGAIVAGLGKYGNLSPGELRKTVHGAVMRYVLTLRRRAAEDGRTLAEMDPIALSSLVIGHRGANMTVQQSTQSILEAIADANILLDETPIQQVQFIELFEDTAFNVASALHSASQNGQIRAVFDFDNTIRTGNGARLRMDYGTEADTWQRISVSRDKVCKSTLNYVAVTDGAKADFNISSVQPEVLDRLIDQSRMNTASQRDLGKLLFELMIPMALKAFAKDDQKILLVLDETTSAYPWELMEDDSNTFGEDMHGRTKNEAFKPLVIRVPVIRQLAIAGKNVPRAKTQTALVIGDPVSTYEPLPGAQTEAELVARRLRDEGAYDVTYLDRPTSGIDVLKAVMLAPSQIIHIAAHGYYDDKNEQHKSGVVISDGVYLTSSEIAQLRYVPELVFLNCCHTGRAEGNTVASIGQSGPIAASLSEALIRKGVRAVVAAGWEVNDAAAHLFAREFYDSMLNGNTFGDAVYHARLAVFAKHPNINTWGAYQCYGDPEYCLDKRAAGSMDATSQKHYYSSAHATKAAINIARDAAGSQRKWQTLIDQLRQIEAVAETGWYVDAAWSEAMGTAYAKLDAYPEAIRFLEKAISRSKSLASISAIELLQDLKVRAATAAWVEADRIATAAPSGAKRDKRNTERHLRARQQDVADEALETLEHLDQLIAVTGQDPRTAQRELLKGTLSKRKFLTERNGSDAANEVLAKMVGHYAASVEIAERNAPDTVRPHPTFNWLCGCIAIGDQTPKGTPIETWFEKMLAQNSILEETAPGFWTAVLPAEVAMLRGILADHADRDEIFDIFTAGFTHAWRRGGALSQARSFHEHVQFLRNVFEGHDSDKAAWLERIEAFLTPFTVP